MNKIQRDFNEEFNSIISELFVPILKNKGFKKKGNNFSRNINDIIQIINIQKSKWNSKDDISFCINVGFFSPQIYSITSELPMPNIPKEYDCFMSFRLGFITHGKDFWYELNQNTNFENFKSTIKNNIDSKLLPVINDYNSLKELGKFYFNNEWLGKIVAPINQFIFLSMLGEREKALGIIKELHENALHPKDTTQTINYPDGSSDIKIIKNKPNVELIEKIKKIAAIYKVIL